MGCELSKIVKAHDKYYVIHTIYSNAAESELEKIITPSVLLQLTIALANRFSSSN
jgi:hypothetical protein